MELKDKKVLVVGLARTGVSTSKFLVSKGAKVRVTDSSPAERLSKALGELKGLDLEVETGRHTEEWFTGADLVVVSPGVPLDIKPLQAALSKGVEIISEIELASRFIDSPIIAITGTNGKTTTTTLIGEILKKGGKRVFVGGNIGNPLIEYVLEGKKADFVVAEISSFQLEGIRDFRPYISVLLNITEDHLDRYPSMDAYVKAKGLIYRNQKHTDYAVVNADDTLVRRLTKGIEPRRVGFSREREVVDGVYFWEGRIVSRLRGNSYEPERFRIKGVHNMENAMASIAACEIAGCSRDEIQEAIETFRGLSHRVEFVAEIGGVSYYNDSKGTNIGATMMALQGFKGNVILLAGGKDKGGDYSVMAPLIQEKVKGMILFGEAREKISQSIGKYADTVLVGSIREAMEVVKRTAVRGDTVLLSPACSSFDQFANYAERGKVFRDLVLGMKQVEPESPGEGC
jgi:UDP-N-acetylmuramoylalanine--D-glutamate ligase